MASVKTEIGKIKKICVNLERRPDRKKSFLETVKQHKVDDINFFEAIDGSKLKLTEKVIQLFDGNDFGWRKNFIGCALSHYQIWKQLENDTNHQQYLIMEDDIKLIDNFNLKFEKAVSMLPTDWEVLYLGYSVFPGFKKQITYIGDDIEVNKFNEKISPGGFFGYLINKEGVNKVLNYIEKNGIKHGIDYLLMKKNSGIKQYEVSPQLITTQYATDTNKVDSDIQYNHDRFIPGKK